MPSRIGTDVVGRLENENTLKKNLRSISISLQTITDNCNLFDRVVCDKCKLEIRLNHYKLYLITKDHLKWESYAELTRIPIPYRVQTIGSSLFRFCISPCLECSAENLCAACSNLLKNIVSPLYVD